MTITPSMPQLHTARLLLRAQEVADAAVFHRLWTQRDERVPAHRKIDADGHPDVHDISAQIADSGDSWLLTVQRIETGDAIGYCGLVFGGVGVSDEPELAFELAADTHNRGYATEAAEAVLAWSADAGWHRVWAGVWEWNLASRRVLEKLGFVESGQERPRSAHGRNLLTVKDLRR